MLKAVEAAGLGEFVDALVCVGIPVVDQGTLTSMVGSTKELFDWARPLLALMGKNKNIIHCGGHGAGLIIK